MKQAAAIFVLLSAGLGSARGDGGAVRFAGDRGPYRVTVFTAPNPFRAGPVDVSVLVQDARTQTPLDDVRVLLRLTPRAGGVDVEAPATRAAATNKLYQAAKFELLSAGEYWCTATIDGPSGPARLEFPVEVLEKLPPWGEFWPWFAWPLVPIGLFALLACSKGYRLRSLSPSGRR